MSTDYDIACRQCFTLVDGWRGEPYKRHADTGLHECRWSDALEKLLPHAEALAAVGSVLKDPVCRWIRDARGDELARICEFFADHKGHPLEVHDEYDRWLTEVKAEEAPQ